MSAEDVCGQPKGLDVGIIFLLIFLTLVGIAVGAEIEFSDFRKLKDNKAAFLIGCSCQFLVMPLCGFLIVNSVDLYSITSGIPNPDVAAASYALGTILTWAAPGGPTSNFFTYLVGGDVSLSVAMSVCSGVLAFLWYPVLVYVLWTIPFEAMANTGECDIKMPFGNMIFGVGVSAGAVFLGILLRRYGSECLRTTMQKALSFFTVLLLVFLSYVTIQNASKTLLTPLKILLGCCVQPVGGLLGFFISKMCGRTNRIASTIAFETGIQNFGLPLTIISLSFHPQAPFIPEMLSAPILACAAYIPWSAVMTIICRQLALTDSENATGEDADLPKLSLNGPQEARGEGPDHAKSASTSQKASAIGHVGGAKATDQVV